MRPWLTFLERALFVVVVAFLIWHAFLAPPLPREGKPTHYLQGHEPRNSSGPRR